MEQTETRSPECYRMEVESVRNPDVENTLQIPDGGWGWVVVFAGFMINFTVAGLISSNGILLLALVDVHGDTISKTAIVGSIFTGISNAAGPFVLLLMMFNASHRQVIICGGFFSCLSSITCFFVDKIEVFYVTFGIFTGGFAGLSYFAGQTVIGFYFKKKRTLATGIANSGSGIGAFALNYLLERSISFYGIRGTFLLMSGLFLNILVYGALCRPLKNFSMEIKKSKEGTLKSEEVLQAETNLGFEADEETTENAERTTTNNSDGSVQLGQSENFSSTKKTSTLASIRSYLRLAIFDPDVLKNPCMQLLVTVYILRSVSETVLLYLLAKAVNVGVSVERGTLIMSIYGAVITFSQLAVGILADFIHIPTSYILMSSLLIMSATALAFTFCHSFALFVLCVSLFGLCKGFVSSLGSAFAASILGLKMLDRGYSFLRVWVGLAYIIFPIIAGTLFDATQSLDVIFYFASSILCLACVTSSGLICMQRNHKFYE